MEITKRTVYEKVIHERLLSCIHKNSRWKTPKTVCVVEGLSGSGKTTYLLEHFNGNSVFYFSFAGLCDDIAEKVFADYVSEKTVKTINGWKDGFTIISKRYKVILFDDISSVLSSERFRKSFYENMITNIDARPFVVLIKQPTDDLSGLADKYDTIKLDYFSVPEVMTTYPTLSKFDILGLCAVSGGIPAILREYDSSKSFQDNLHDFFKPSSAFLDFMPELLSKYFRKTEGYHYILYAIANGNHSVSEIGKFTGYAYNKCDNYLSALISCDIIKAEKATSKRGAKKTAYRFANNYFRLWHLYVYMNRTDIQLGNQKLIENIVKNIIEREIHKFHLQRAFAYVNEKIWDSSVWASFRIKPNMTYSPQTISEDTFSYDFDAIAKNGDKAIFVKIFADPHENCKRDELAKIRMAVMLENVYYDSRVYIFAKRRFNDYTVSDTVDDEVISLVDVDKLRF